MAETESQPIYCKDCGSSNSWERDDEHDLLYESGKIFEKCWRCKLCGKTTLSPAALKVNSDKSQKKK